MISTPASGEVSGEVSDEGAVRAEPPLAGVRVLDLSWLMVGPFSVRYLTDLGADVIKIESSTRTDPLRTLPPFRNGRPDPERSLAYHFINAGKRSVDLDLASPQGRDIALELAEQADVVVESFTPGVVDRLGLGYDDIRRRSPDIIMVSTNVAGRAPFGPERSGVGTLGAAMSGAMHLVGYPDEPPTGPFGPWTDAIAPRFIVPSVLAALRRRARTGEGCYIEVSQAEAGIQLVLPALFDYLANGTVTPPAGATPDHSRSPCGLYPCAGHDRWVAIDAAPGRQWEALQAAVGPPLDEHRYRTLLGRLRERDHLDTAIATWTRDQEAHGVETRLQSAGVPAHVVSSAADLHEDPHILATYLAPVSDPLLGDVQLTRPQFTLERSPLVPVKRGPRTGEHTAEVLRDLRL
ncbi:CoA transferase [Pseudonocardia sp.]|uniref:CaiB/BaiF CoA transferase family protein n=1 Tax=Pseudonocardia sp. TaxID=60912 RepID=UPI0031FD2DCD